MNVLLYVSQQFPLYPSASEHKCSAVQGGLPSKFTSEKPYILASYVMQESKCIHLQIMHYG